MRTTRPDEAAAPDTGRPEPSLAQRLLRLAALEPATGCWNRRRDLPATRLSVLGETQPARISFALWRGALRPGTDPVPICRNRRCINPWHLADRKSRTHCARGHPRLPENLIPNILYEVVDGVRRPVISWICRVCRERSIQGRKPRVRPTQPWIWSIEDSDEREVESMIRLVCRARKGRRLDVLKARIARLGEKWIPEIRFRALPGEGWWDYVDRLRSADEGSWIEWALSRVLDDPRVGRELLRAPKLQDPLLIAEAERARATGTERDGAARPD